MVPSSSTGQEQRQLYSFLKFEQVKKKFSSRGLQQDVFMDTANAIIMRQEATKGSKEPVENRKGLTGQAVQVSLSNAVTF